MSHRKLPVTFCAEKIDDLAIEKYRQWPWLSYVELSGVHWGLFISIYVKKGAAAYRSNHLNYVQEFYEDEEPVYLKYPAGTIIVKENYSSLNGKADHPLSLTIMIKHQVGFDREFGDWEYVQVLTDGKVVVRGKASSPKVKSLCTDCHVNVTARDFVFSTVISASALK